MTLNILTDIEQDCKTHGRGRKTWWAAKLGIPQLTLSHWLARRQNPNAKHLLAIQEVLNQGKHDEEANAWLSALIDTYYAGKISDCKSLLPLIIPKILSANLDSRGLAFLSWIVEREKIKFSPCDNDELRNRLGWMMELARLSPSFPVSRTAKTQNILRLTHTASPMLKKHLKAQQTPLGKKWKILDCDLTATKASFI